MSEWYYAAGPDRRIGPLSGSDLVSAFRQGSISLATPVWREGQAQWRPLGDFSGELGLTGETGSILPPPVPAGPIPMPPASPPRRAGLSGCMIAIIVAAVLAIPAIGILAAIAIPAYQQYVERARIASALPIAEPHKPAVSSYLATERECPGNEDSGFQSPEHYAQGAVASITFGRFESELCGMEVILAVPGSDKLDGKALWLEYDPADSSWHCSSEVDDRFLPAECRG